MNKLSLTMVFLGGVVAIGQGAAMAQEVGLPDQLPITGSVGPVVLPTKPLPTPMPTIPDVPVAPIPSVGGAASAVTQTVNGVTGSARLPSGVIPALPVPGSPTVSNPREVTPTSGARDIPVVTLRHSECRLVATEPPNLDFSDIPALGKASEYARSFSLSVYCPDDRGVRVVTRVSLSGRQHPSEIPVTIRPYDGSGQDQSAAVVFFHDGQPIGEQVLHTGGQEKIVAISAQLVDPTAPESIPRTMGTIEMRSRASLYLVEDGTKVPRVSALEASGVGQQTPWIEVSSPVN